MIPTLDELKAQCRVDGDHEDDLLKLYAAAAKRSVENFVNRPLFEDAVPESASSGILIDEDIKLAIMLLVGHWYNVREPVSVGVSVSKVPLTFQFLLEPYRIIPL